MQGRAIYLHAMWEWLQKATEFDVEMWCASQLTAVCSLPLLNQAPVAA